MINGLSCCLLSAPNRCRLGVDSASLGSMRITRADLLHAPMTNASATVVRGLISQLTPLVFQTRRSSDAFNEYCRVGREPMWNQPAVTIKC